MHALFADAMADNLLPARLQMAVTLGFHIILACLGVGLPVLLLVAEWRFLKTGDELWRTLAKRWSKAFAVLFAVGAISGTVLSFELGLLWPEFMGTWGGVIGLPFTMEAFAFFLEAIFVGIYLYGWDRLPPKVHWWTGWPIAISGFFSAFFVVTANSWMNAPAGFTLTAGELTDVDPWAAMFNVATGAQVTHMIVAAYLVTGFTVAGYYAWRLMRDRDNEYNRRAFTLAMLLALPLVPVQMAVGDWSAKVVAQSQPVKFAAMEGVFQTTTHAPLHIGGIPDETAREMRYSIEVPGMLSWMGYGETAAEVKGLDDFPRDETPSATVVHLAFQTMVGIGTLMLVVAVWCAWCFWRTRVWPKSKWFLRTVVLMGPLSIVALQTGWIVTEVGRQPWIVQGHMKTAEAVTTAPGVWNVFIVTLAIYAVIGTATVFVLRQLAKAPLQEDSHGAG